MILNVQEVAILRALARFASKERREGARECLQALAATLGVAVDLEEGTITIPDVDEVNRVRPWLFVRSVHAWRRQSGGV